MSVMDSQEHLQHIARTLHDKASQSLYSASMMAEMLARILRQEESPHAEIADRISEVVAEAMMEIRLILLDARTPILGDKMLSNALQEYVEFLRKEVVLSVLGDKAIRQFPRIAEAFFSISKEAIANAVRHAEANHIVVKIEDVGTEINLEVTDNGDGFDLNTTGPGIGISLMTQLAESLGGRLALKSQSGEGTTLTASIPKYFSQGSE